MLSWRANTKDVFPRMIYIFASAKVWIGLRRILRLFQKSFSVQRSTCSKNKNPSMTNSVERYRKSATVMVLKDAINDQYDFIDWWLYEGAPDYKIWNEDESIEWDLTEPEALYDFITTECK